MLYFQVRRTCFWNSYLALKRVGVQAKIYMEKRMLTGLFVWTVRLTKLWRYVRWKGFGSKLRDKSLTCCCILIQYSRSTSSYRTWWYSYSVVPVLETSAGGVGGASKQPLFPAAADRLHYNSLVPILCPAAGWLVWSRCRAPLGPFEIVRRVAPHDTLKILDVTKAIAAIWVWSNAVSNL